MRIFKIDSQNSTAKRMSSQTTPSFQSRPPEATKEDLKTIDEQYKKISIYSLMGNHLYWQSHTLDGVRNKKNIEELSEASQEIGGVCHNLLVDPKFVKAISNLHNDDEDLSIRQKATVKLLYKDVNESLKLTENQIKTSQKLEDNSYMAWEDLKPKADFAGVLPDLKAMLDNKKELKSIVAGHEATYDDYLDDYVPGWTTKDIDPILNDLGDKLTPVLKKVQAKIAEDPSINELPFLKNPVSQKTIDVFVDRVAKDMGFDFERGRISKTEHPFMATMNGSYDTRFCVEKPKENPTIADFLDTATSAIHECGHALVEQNMPESLHNTPLNDFPMDLHESQSRLWENIIGRSKEFWQHYLPVLKEIDPKAFEDVTADDLYRGVNLAKQNPIRIQGDELSYNLHILQRYNLEKEFVNNKDFDFKTLPEKWNKESEKLLGVTPKNNTEGVMQDVHWYDGLVGYFPSYSLGSLAYPQFYNAMKKSMPDLEEKISKGEFKPITKWLTENVYKDGKTYSSKEIIEKATGEPLNSKYFTDYITKKYSEIYNV